MQLKVTQIRSVRGTTKRQRDNLRALGLTTKIGRTVNLPNTPDIRGKVKKILHIVRVEEVQS